MNQASRLSLWMGTAFCIALAATGLAFAHDGYGSDGTLVALRLTARVSFLLFWPAYAGSAARAVFGSIFGFLARRGLEFGLAFAASQLVHLSLVVWLAWISPPEPFMAAVMPFFAIGMVWTYLLALSSLDGASKLLRPPLLGTVRNVGLEYIALTFFVDFVVGPQYPLQRPWQYVPFWVMLGAGSLLRLAACVRRLSRPRSAPAA